MLNNNYILIMGLKTYSLLINCAFALNIQSKADIKTNDFFHYMGDFGSKLTFLALEK